VARMKSRLGPPWLCLSPHFGGARLVVSVVVLERSTRLLARLRTEWGCPRVRRETWTQSQTSSDCMTPLKRHWTITPGTTSF